jgi:hypothetical protein
MEIVMKKLNALVTLSAALALGSFVKADVLALWKNDHLAGNEVSTTAGEGTSGGSWDPLLAAAPILSRGPGGTPPTAYTDTFGFQNGNAATLTDAISADRYVTFSLQASAGYQIDYSSLFIRIYTQDQTVNMSLFSSKTGTYADGNQLSNWSFPVNAASTTATLDLSSVAALQDVKTSTEFRLYYWGKTSATAQVGIGRGYTNNTQDDLRVDGTITAIPEPGALALAAIALGTCVLFLRRKK